MITRHLDIRDSTDVIPARQEGREMARELGFGLADQTRIATAISELSRNVVQHAGRGTIALRVVRADGRDGLEVVVSDEGPGIVDVELALQEGFSTRGSLGFGLPGTRRLVDEFELASRPGQGTTVTVRMWLQ